MRRDERRTARGAKSHNTGYGDMIRAWRLHHQHSAKQSLLRLVKTPIQTLMTGLVVAIALALPATLLLTMQNIERLGERWDATPKISVFLHVRAKEAAINHLKAALEQRAEVHTVEYLSPEAALAQFQAQSGFSDVLNGLEDNPLPPTLVVTPSATARTTAQFAELTEWLQASQIVDSVEYDMAWVKRLRAMMALGQKLVLALASLLGLGVLLAIGNTVRLAIENRKEEIIIIKLVGGTNGFVRRPFLYSGIWYGLFGGFLACLLVAIGFASLQGAVADLASAYSTRFQLDNLGAREGLALLGVSMVLGWLGAWLAVGRHLHQIEPR